MKTKGVVDLRQRKAGAPQARPLAPVAEKRPLSLRSRRRRARLMIFGVMLLICALAAYAIHWASYLPQYSIGDIRVDGTRALAAEDVRGFVETQLNTGDWKFISPRNIFAYDRAGIMEAVASFSPRIASADISRPSLFSTELVVSVRERDPYALWCDDAQTCYSLDETGFIFTDAASSSPATGYIFKGGVATSSPPIGQYVVQAHFAGIVTLFKLLGQAGFSPQSVRIENDSDISIMLAQGYLLRASFGQDAPALVRDLQLILSSDALAGKDANIDYIDLRFGDRVYYKLKGEGESQTTASSTRR